ncbi:NAD(P)/FAD-dependent oxidoreductase [Cognatishimia sp. WU-CL00825]|uniref:NAD(P)/FAD-dependent oxidoreductase n=1 Tax=Cognatishimia sp. WU-CL00825 TaxID=3127658 RepID=UPI00310327AC
MDYNTVILGAGAAGLMCAAHCKGKTLVLDHAKNPGEKIRISGGGRCNFTNLYASHENFISQNPHFCKSALSRYSQWDFLELIAKHNIAYHEKTLGQLFCDNSAKDIIQMLLDEMKESGAELWTQTNILSVSYSNDFYTVEIERAGKRREIRCTNLVLATGGKSIPKMGATGLAYDIARQFGLTLTDVRPALVPFTFPEGRYKPLAGVSLPVRIASGQTQFEEAMLFTHRGLSGPAVLQISSYWTEGAPITVNLSPTSDLFETLRQKRISDGRRNLSTIMAQIFPTRLADYLVKELALHGNIADQSDAALSKLATQLTQWQLTPSGTEGYRTAEVTLGGISTDNLSSKTMQAKNQPGLYVIGEAVDVTGWLGGFNFQWAWSSGFAAGQAIQQALPKSAA